MTRTIRVNANDWRNLKFRRDILRAAREDAARRMLIKIKVKLDYCNGYELIARIEGRW